MIKLNDLETEDKFNFFIQIIFLVSDIPIFFSLLFIKAYYGKFFNSNSEKTNCIHKLLRAIFPVIPSRISWIIQECPCVFITLFFLIYAHSELTFRKILVILPFLIHYIHRTFIFPFVIHSSKNNPLEITLMAFTFCFFNAIMINRSIFYFSDYENDFWLYYILLKFTSLIKLKLFFKNIYSL